MTVRTRTFSSFAKTFGPLCVAALGAIVPLTEPGRFTINVSEYAS